MWHSITSKEGQGTRKSAPTHKRLLPNVLLQKKKWCAGEVEVAAGVQETGDERTKGGRIDREGGRRVT